MELGKQVSTIDKVSLLARQHYVVRVSPSNTNGKELAHKRTGCIGILKLAACRSLMCRGKNR